VRRVVAASVTYRTDGLHPDLATAQAGAALDQLDGTPFHDAYVAVAPQPERWHTLVAKNFDLDAQPQEWPTETIRAIEAPVMLVVADSDIVRLEHAVELFHLLGGGVVGDLDGLPRCRLAVVPGTSHVGLIDRSDWLIPMITEFLDGARSTNPEAPQPRRSSGRT
jgi:pimeloyl-ACP methyl ester carboxylesterase